MELKDFYYDLPQELIAQTPLQERTDSRLMLLNKHSGEIRHAHFRDLPGFLKPGDCLVLNDTKVLPARLIGVRKLTEQAPNGTDGAPVELLLLRRLTAGELPEGYDPEDGVYWETLAGPGKRAKEGYTIVFGDGKLVAKVIRVLPDGNRQVHFRFEGVFEEILDQLGQMPLPPYIHETLQDRDRYQTVYAREEGSAAAPTAGLHFTEALLEKIRAQGVKTVFVTLHVGLGTFRPVKEDQIEDHVMHKEWYTVTPEAAREINAVKEAGGRIIAVGTTSCRTLESAADENGMIIPGGRETGIYIYPGYRFKAIDALITNFHLPESTLIMLVSALAGREHVMAAYEEAVRERYRFFSFGDAMLIC